MLGFSGERDLELRQQIIKLASQEIHEYWALLQNISTLIVVINMLPFKGFLWSGKLSPVKNAFFGLVSSLIGLFMVARPIQEKQKQKGA